MSFGGLKLPSEYQLQQNNGYQLLCYNFLSLDYMRTAVVKEISVHLFYKTETANDFPQLQQAAQVSRPFCWRGEYLEAWTGCGDVDCVQTIEESEVPLQEFHYRNNLLLHQGSLRTKLMWEEKEYLISGKGVQCHACNQNGARKTGVY